MRAAKLCLRCSPSPGRELQIRRKKSHSDYSSDYKSQKAEIQFFIATIVATTKYTVQRFWNLWLVKNEDQKIPLNGMRIGLRFWLFLLRKKSASIAFWYQNAACRENPDPNAACGRRTNAELRHKPETHVGAAVCSAAWGALCRCVRFYGQTAHPWRSVPHKRHARPPWRREENRTINFTWVILFGHSKTNFDSQHGRKEAK